MNKNIAITIQNLVQFYSIEKGIEILKKNNLNVDIYVPTTTIEGFKDMYDYTYNFLKQKGYEPLRKVKNKKYRIVLEADYMEDYFNFDTDYLLKYKYGVSVKPKLSFTAYHNIIFDGILCYCTYEKEMLGLYTKTWNVGNLKFIDYKKNNKFLFNKKRILYLPTYDNVEEIEKILLIVKKLKKQYSFSIKLHHGTSFLRNEESIKEKIYNIFDKVYEHDTNLVELLKETDVVITDISGAIFEAIYGDTPVGIISKNCEKFKYNNIEPLQQKYINSNKIPYTDNFEDLKTIIKKCLKTETLNKQLEIKKELFPLANNELETNFMGIINFYLKNDINIEKKLLRNNFIKEYYEYANNYENLKLENKFLNESLIDKDKQIEYYKSQIKN